MTRCVAIVQARMSSERLPGKVLMPLGGTPVLLQVIERLKRASMLSQVVVATSDQPEDDPIAALARSSGCEVYRGSLTDVLARFAGAARAAAADTIVRITADCPLVAPEIVDAMISLHANSAKSLNRPLMVTNARRRSFPRGLDVEVFAREALDVADRDATSPHQREHVTPYIYEHPEAFEIVDYTQSRDLSGARWTLDTAEDYRMLTEFFALMGERGNPTFSELIRIWDSNPALQKINAGVAQKTY